MDIELPNDFKEFLKLLNSYQVEYLLIGGYAVAYHGYPRATNDMDVWVAIHPDNAERLVSVMQAFGFSVPELSKELSCKKKRSFGWVYRLCGSKSLLASPACVQGMLRRPHRK